MIMKEIKEIFKKIKQADEIIIARHTGPDVDALASQIALRDSILLTFPGKKVYAVGASVGRLSFLGSLNNNVTNNEDALLILVDVPDVKRVDGVELAIYQNTIKIDHHPLMDLRCNIEWVDESASSAAQLISQLILNTKLVINKEIAEKLFLGIVADSNRFLFTNNSTKIFRDVADLIDASELDITPLYYKLYKRSMGELKFQGFIASNFIITENGLAHIYIPHEKLIEYRVDAATAGNMINNFNYVKDVYVWVIFTEDKNNNVIRVSIRSRKPVINDIAEEFGGGGHFFASGVKLKDSTEIEKVVEKLDLRLKEIA